MNKGIRSFDRAQTKTLLVCFVIYFCAYLGRLNLSATLDYIMQSFAGIGKTRAGLIQTVFAVTYAGGQLLFGSISDHIRPKRLILTGLLGSALCNLLFSFMNGYVPLLICWTGNGIFQSMIWTPIVIYMAHTFRPEQRKSASFILSLTLALGNLAAWGCSIGVTEGLLLTGMSVSEAWRYSYRIPTLMLCVAALTAFFMLPSGLRSASKGANDAQRAPVGKLIGTGLLFMLLCCIMNGFIRDGVITWAPTIVSGKSKLSSLVIPCINLLGIMLGSFLVRKARINIRALIGLMMLCVGLFALTLAFSKSAAAPVLALLLGVTSALLYGTNPLLTTLTPMQYEGFGRVGLVAGLIDCSIYLGSSLAGFLSGLISEAYGSWYGVYVSWTVAACIGACSAIIASKVRRCPK